MENFNSIVGKWRCISQKSKPLDLILEFSENGKFKIYGTLFIDLQKPLGFDDINFAINETVVEISGYGKYFIEADKIIMSGNTAILQRTNLNTGGFAVETYEYKINYDGKFEKTEENTAHKLLLEDGCGILSFKEFYKIVKI